MNLPPKEEINISLFGSDKSLLTYFSSHSSSLHDLAKVKIVKTFSSDENRPAKSIMKASVDHEVFIPLEGVIDLGEQVKRLEKDLAKSEKELQKLEKKLSNPKFISNAKPEVVEQVKIDFELERQKAEAIRENLVNFK